MGLESRLRAVHNGACSSDSPLPASAAMATAKIDIVGPQEYPIVADLYSQIFRPPKTAEFFRRRFLGRYHGLVLLASLEGRPVGFFCGFELKPSVFFSWLYGVQPEC